MIDTKNMDDIFNNNYKKAQEIIKSFRNKNIDELKMMLDLQFDLMLHIIQKKQLWNYGLDKLMSNMVLSILDEINEYKDWINKVGLYDGKKVFMEARFEIVDAVHFVLQLALLSSIKAHNYSLEFLKEHKAEITNEAFDILNAKSYKATDNIDIYMQLSYILDKLHWKHWKTYETFDNESLNIELCILYITLQDLFKKYTSLDDYKLVDFYVMKNIENFDRQNNGY